MQNIKIDVYISDLLYSYDCVVIPDFGGFVANYASAKIQPIQHKITPPSKQISFNKNLKSNDGLLSNRIAQKQSFSYSEANELIKAFVDQSIEGLNNGDKIKIEKVGTLFLDPERNIQFIAEEKNDFLLDSFGLGSMRLQPIFRAGAEERIQKEIKKVIPIAKVGEKKRRSIFWPAAAMLLVLFVGAYFLNLQYNVVDTSTVQYSNLFNIDKGASLFEERKATDFKEFNGKADELKLAKGIFQYTISLVETTNIWVDNRTEEVEPKVDNTKVDNAKLKQDLRYHVMGGCFSNKRNAERLVKNLINKGYDARLLGKFKNYHAVSFGSFVSDSDARALLSKIKSNENKAAWLLAKQF
tara:strand:- start:7497 stop:8561 length:1065 start_codon:yes stop_codon:yes gene_type:complete